MRSLNRIWDDNIKQIIQEKNITDIQIIEEVQGR
jgi:hypothetical protein